MTTYTVRAGRAIAKRGVGHVRRRGGMAFGSDPVTFTDADLLATHGGDEAKADAALKAILGDPHLRVKTSEGGADLEAPPELPPDESVVTTAEEPAKPSPKKSPRKVATSKK